MSSLSKTVCLIDDDKIYQFTSRKIIESTHLAGEILSFYNGEEAIQYFKAQLTNDGPLPDVILLDINMPTMDGWQFLDEFGKLSFKEKKPSIFMVSSSLDEQDIAKAKSYDCLTEYIIKPINKERFEQLISSK